METFAVLREDGQWDVINKGIGLAREGSVTAGLPRPVEIITLTIRE